MLGVRLAESFLGEIFEAAKNRRLLPRPFAQVLISRTLSVCGEVAERLKAAVC